MVVNSPLIRSYCLGVLGGIRGMGPVDSHEPWQVASNSSASPPRIWCYERANPSPSPELQGEKLSFGCQARLEIGRKWCFAICEKMTGSVKRENVIRMWKGWDCLVVRLRLRIFNFQWKTPEQSLEISASQTTQWWAASHPICKFQWLQQGSGCQRCSWSPWFDDFDGVLYHFVYYEQTNVSSRWLWHQLVSRVCCFFLNDQVARWWFEAFLFCFPDPSKDDPIWLIIIILAAKDGYVAPPVPAVVQAESVKISAVDTTAAWFQKRSSILVGIFFK